MARSRTRMSLAVVAAAALLATAGCGVQQKESGAKGIGPGTPTDGPTVEGPKKPTDFEGTGGVVFLQQAAEATSSVKTQRMTMELKMTGVPMFGTMAMKVDGALDLENKRSQMTMDMSEFLGGMGGSEAEGMGKMEMIVDGDTTYIKSPMFSELSGSKKPWMKTDTEALSDSGTMDKTQGDPKAFLDFLKKSGSAVEEVGTEDVRGVSTTHLRTTLDIKKMMADAPASEKAEMEKQLKDIGASEVFSEIPTEAWIDDDGMVRKMQMTFDFSKVDTSSDPDLAEMKDVKMVMAFEMFDFNKPVDIEIPDASQVGELDPSVFGGN